MTVHNETHIQPFVVLHGTTGQVLYWSYSDLQNHCTYVNMLPGKDDMSREAAAELGRSRCTEAVRSMVCPVFEGSMELAFGTAGNWMPVGEEEAPMSVWRVTVQTGAESPGYRYLLLAVAEDESILWEELYSWDAEGAITECMKYIAAPVGPGSNPLPAHSIH